MNLGLEGKRVLVLAASSGLGRAIATQLAQEGARVVICGRDLARIEEAAESIRSTASGELGGAGSAEVHPLMADVRDPEALKRLMSDAVERLGGLDALVCNAGGPPPGDFAKLDDSAWEAAFQLTLMSVVRSIREALPHLRESGGGSILVLGSSSVKQPIPGLLLSNVFRPGIYGMLKHLASELAPDAIRVNFLSPGRIKTDRLEQLDTARAEREGRSFAAVRADSVKAIPLGRLGDPAEFARVATFLLSPAASYVTGSSVLVDGGMVKGL